MRGPEILRRWCMASLGQDSGPSALLVAAHPDDEVIGAGARLRHLADVQIVHVTDGVPHDVGYARAAGQPSRTAYSKLRRQELLAAMELAGVAPTRLERFGLVDQEAARALPGLTLALVGLFRASTPEVVVTHPYEGGHPDHDATAFAVHHACNLLLINGEESPVILEMTAYHLSDGAIRTGDFLPGPEPAVVPPPSRDDLVCKRRMLDCFVSQRSTLAWFGVGLERFRLAPTYDFTQPPQVGGVFYEQFEWGMTSLDWQSLVHDARQHLGLANKPAA